MASFDLHDWSSYSDTQLRDAASEAIEVMLILALGGGAFPESDDVELFQTDVANLHKEIETREAAKRDFQREVEAELDGFDWDALDDMSDLGWEDDSIDPDDPFGPYGQGYGY